MPKVKLLFGGNIVYLPDIHSDIQCYTASYLEKGMLPVHLLRFLSISSNIPMKFLFKFIELLPGARVWIRDREFKYNL